MNALLPIVLPDSSGSYSYFLETCGKCEKRSCVIHHMDKTFQIIGDNKFNVKNPSRRECETTGNAIFSGSVSYAEAVKWGDFIQDPNFYIDAALDRRDHCENYKICKTINC